MQMSTKEQKKTKKQVSSRIRESKKEKRASSSEYPNAKIWRKMLQKKRSLLSRIQTNS